MKPSPFRVGLVPRPTLRYVAACAVGPLFLAGTLDVVFASGTRGALILLLFLLWLPVILVLGTGWTLYNAEGDARSAWLVVSFRVVKVCVLIVVLCCMGPVLYGIITIDEREPYRRSACSNHLRAIGLAMHNYSNAYGCLPPAYVADTEGRPMYSWRVLLLEFTDGRGKELHDAFHLDEPWNSAHNSGLLEATPQYPMFTCPSDRRNPGTETNYVMLVGPGSLSAGTNCVTLDEISDGTSLTIAVVEVVGSGILWTEPRDLVAEEINFRINDPERPGIGSRHPGGMQVLLCDGAVTFVSETTDPELLRAMTTIAGGEDISESYDAYLGRFIPRATQP
ncbi:DUF1559 domain-containing protein [Planctomycetota bacterium]